MNTSRYFFASALILWVCGGLQQGIAFKLSLFGAQPDYIFVGVCILGLLGDMRCALIVGCIAGVMEGAIIGTDMWQFVLTRMLAAGIGAYLAESRFQRNYATSALVTSICTVLCGLVFMIIALQSNIGATLGATIITAVYNGVLALLAYVPLERATGVRSQQL